jgi:hypothetical protein
VYQNPCHNQRLINHGTKRVVGYTTALTSRAGLPPAERAQSRQCSRAQCDIAALSGGALGASSHTPSLLAPVEGGPVLVSRVRPLPAAAWPGMSQPQPGRCVRRMGSTSGRVGGVRAQRASSRPCVRVWYAPSHRSCQTPRGILSPCASRTWQIRAQQQFRCRALRGIACAWIAWRRSASERSSQ